MLKIITGTRRSTLKLYNEETLKIQGVTKNFDDIRSGLLSSGNKSA